MITSKVGRRGQITIPQTIRHRLNLEQGDRIAFIRQNGDIILQPLTKTLFDLRGSIPVTEPQDFAHIRQQVLETRVQKGLKNGD
jgi:AbrB family looped-hinge helix DNA binding protein